MIKTIASFGDDEFQDVEISLRGGIGLMILNREKALNALSMPMIDVMLRQLKQWRDDDRVKIIVLTHRPGSKAFCAGGDIRSLWEILSKSPAAGGGADLAHHYFAKEYRLDGTLYHYPKPTIALINGLWMGGGVGIGLHCHYRIVGEQAIFAMPEGLIGFFPDVGASYELSRLPSRLGLWLGLTAERLGAKNSCHLGLASHFMRAEQFPALLDDLEQLSRNGGEAKDLTAKLTELLAQAASQAGTMPELGKNEADTSNEEFQATIAACFARDDVKKIATRLKQAANDGQAWAAQAMVNFDRMSPTSQILLTKAYEQAKDLDFIAVLRQDLTLARYFCSQQSDLVEGVRALIIDKDNRPQWQPASLAAAYEPKYLKAMMAKAFTPTTDELAYQFDGV